MARKAALLSKYCDHFNKHVADMTPILAGEGVALFCISDFKWQLKYTNYNGLYLLLIDEE
jgi:hypothetical protein